jgi:hypothetical protein
MREREHRGVRVAVGVGLAAALAVIGAVVAVIATQGHHRRSASIGQPAAPATAPAGGTAIGPVAPPRGASLRDGVFVGYQHTSLGAIGAACEYLSDLGSTLSPDRAAAVVRLVGDPASPGNPAAAAAGIVQTLSQLGLPTAGPLPTGVSYATVPQAYQLRDVDADHVTVLLLGSDYLTAADGTVRDDEVGAYPVRLRWVDGDWRLTDIGDSVDYSNLIAAPGSPQAAADGWIPLLTASTGTGG